MGAEQALGFEDGRLIPPATPRLAGPSDPVPNGSLFAGWRNERPRPESVFLERMSRGDSATWLGAGLAVGLAFISLAVAFAGPAGVAFVLLVMAAAVGFYAIRPKQETADLFDGVYDAPGDLPQFAVYTTLKAGCIEYGSDTGVVSFSDGWMHYQGLRTEFHIARDSTIRDGVHATFPGSTDLSVRLSDGVVNATLRMIPVTRTGSIAVKYPEDLVSSWHQWRMTPAQGRSLYPPCSPSLHSVRKAQRRAMTRKVLLASCFGFGLWMLAQGWEFDSFVFFITVGILLALYVFAAQAGQTVRALRRMQHESPNLALVNSLNRKVRLAMLNPGSLWR